MRHEVESVVAEYGWTRGALHKLSKLDSFVKESHRMNAISSCQCTLPPFDFFYINFTSLSVLMVRETLEDLILSDGTLISRGTHVGIASGAISMSEVHKFMIAQAKTDTFFRSITKVQIPSKGLGSLRCVKVTESLTP